MSERALNAGLKAYPEKIIGTKNTLLDPNAPIDANIPARIYYMEGYKQAEKDTIEMAAEWFRTHWREYIMGPDADGCVGFGHWENDFKKAMEEDI